MLLEDFEFLQGDLGKKNKKIDRDSTEGKKGDEAQLECYLWLLLKQR